MRDGNLEANFPSSSYHILHAEGPRDSGRGGEGPQGHPRAEGVQGLVIWFINYVIRVEESKSFQRRY